MALVCNLRNLQAIGRQTGIFPQLRGHHSLDESYIDRGKRGIAGGAMACRGRMRYTDFLNVN